MFVVAVLLISFAAIQGEVVKKVGDKCDRTSSDNFPAVDPAKYLYCALNGTLQQYSCPSGKVYNVAKKGCELPATSTNATKPISPVLNATQDDSVFWQPGICAQGTAYSTPGTVQPMTCLPQLGTVGCPPNYNCQFSATSQQYYCCPANTQPQSGCPVNTQPLTNTAGSQICNLFDPNSCPQPYKCTQSTINPGQSICCTTATSSSSIVCPSGGPAYNVGGQVQTCSLSQPCPGALSCTTVLSGTGSQNVCCPQSAVTNNVCGTAMAQIVNGQMQTCNGGQFCAAGYSCQLYAATNTYYCCSAATSQSNGCPGGLTAEMQNGAVKFCSPVVSNCGIGYSCQFSSTNSNYQCCGTSQITQDSGCPSGQSLYPTANPSISLCPPSGNNCPAPYSCVWSVAKQQQLCCGATQPQPNAQPACPNNANAYVFPGSTLPMSCSLSFPNCPAGYGCQQATNGQAYVCCSSLPNLGVCPAGQTQVLSGGMPQQCGIGRPDCPVNSYCSQPAQICCQNGPAVNNCQAGYLQVNGVCRRLQCSLVD